MKKLFLIFFIVTLCISLCACDNVDTVTTNSTGDFHIERHYQDNGDLFCIVETNIKTGTVITTYFYWKHDDHGRRTLSSTECITIDNSGSLVTHVCTPGHS